MSAPRPVLGVGVLGAGTVGSQVIRILQSSREDFAARSGAEMEVRRVLVRNVDAPRDAPIDRELLTTGLGELGYEFVEPQGAFYLWVRALEDDAQAFSDRAKAHELLLVPSDSFGVGGWVRVSYCVSREVIERSMPAFKALKESYEG